MDVTIRFYAELNDFLPKGRRFTTIELRFDAPVSIKDVVEAHGVPHTEVDLLLANGDPVPFSYLVRHGDRLAVYPVFESFDIAGTTRVRPAPLRESKFVLDVHLGRLAHYLRLAGFDSLCPPGADDAELAGLSQRERRIVLTRDLGLLKRRAVTHGYFVRATAPAAQLAEVVRRFDLAGTVKPFSRCLVCNGLLEDVEKQDVEAEVPERSRRRFEDYRRCLACRRVYWAGSHHSRLKEILGNALGRDEIAR